MAIIYVMCGVPGSGKSTLARELATQHNAVVHSYDDIPGANTRAGMDGSVQQAWINNIRTDLKAGVSVVCDNINLSVENRTDILSSLSDIICRKVLVVKDVPLEVCLQRNAQRQTQLPDFVIEQAMEKMEWPTEKEGWDEIFVYSD